MLGLKKIILSFAGFLLLFLSPVPIFGAQQVSAKYLVVQVQNHEGKISHKPLAEKELETFKKTLDDEFQKVRKSYQEEKADFQKKNGGKKFEKPEPQRPKTKVVKRDIKTFNEAMKIAFDLDKEKEKKNGKNGKNGKNESSKNSE